MDQTQISRELIIIKRMAREVGREPMIDTGCLDNSSQSLRLLNQSHDSIKDKLFSQQLHNINKLRNQKLRCYLCETPKQEYSLIRTFGELVCRGCFNYEGKDRIEQLIENARQFKFAQQLIHNNSSSSSSSSSKIMRPGAIVENDNSSMRIVDKLPESSPSHIDSLSNGISNKEFKEQQHRKQTRVLPKNDKQEDQSEGQINEGQGKRTRQVEVQLPTLSMSGAKSKVVSPSANSKQSTKITVLPSIDTFSNQVTSKQSALASTVQKQNSNQLPSIYKQTKCSSSNSAEPNQQQLSSSPAQLMSQVDYNKMMGTEEQRELAEDRLPSRLEQLHQHQSRLQFDPNNLPYPMLLPASKNLGSLNGSQLDHHCHSGWFRHPSMALQSPNAVYQQAVPSQEIMAGISATNGIKRGRSFLGNHCNGHDSAFPFGSYPMIPSNVLYQGPNLQTIYGSPGSIYYSPHHNQQQFNSYPLSPLSQGSAQHKSPTLLLSPSCASSPSSHSNQFTNSSSTIYLKSGQVVHDTRLRSNMSSTNQEQREASQQLLPQTQLSENNSPINAARQQQQEAKDRQQTLQKESTFQRALSDSPTTTRDQINVNKPGNVSPPRIDQNFSGSQSSPQLIPAKQSSLLLNNPASEMRKTFDCRILNHRDNSSLARNLQLYESNSSATEDGKQQTNSLATRVESRELNQRKAGTARKTTEVAGRNSAQHDIYEKQKETSRLAHENESDSILRQKLSDNKLNNASSKKGVSEETIVIDVEDDIEQPTNDVNTTMTIPESNIDDVPYPFDSQQSSESQQVAPLRAPVVQPLTSAAMDRLISNQSRSNPSSNLRSMDEICNGTPKSNSNIPAEDTTTTTTINSLQGNGKQSSPGNNSCYELKLNCLMCSKNLVDRHFVQCPSVLVHKFCFACTRNSIRDQRGKHKLREGETEKSEKCPLTGQQEPWTFMTSEIETIFREKDKQMSPPEQVRNVPSSLVVAAETTAKKASVSSSFQQKLKRKSKPTIDETPRKKIAEESFANGDSYLRSMRSKRLDSAKNN